MMQYSLNNLIELAIHCHQTRPVIRHQLFANITEVYPVNQNYFLSVFDEAAQLCGQRFSTSKSTSTLPTRRIVNGRNTTIQEWPWMVALLLNGNIVCGGSLVAPQSIVTAAHCLIGK